MRKIKFRAWDVITKRFYFSHYDDIPDPSFFDDAFNEHPYDFLTVEQFTGLCDKNGKDIYEGDIVKTSSELIAPIKFYKSLNFDSGGGVHSGFYYKEEVEYYDDGSSDWEIIGNIHENPELLKEQP